MGGKTYVISLPASWIRKYKIQKGQELELDVLDHEIKVSTNTVPQLHKLKLNLDKASQSLLVKKITTAYQLGYEELTLSFQKDIENTKTSKKVKTINVVEETCDQLIGFEVIKQSNTSCFIKDVAGRDINEFMNVLRRTFLMLNSLGQESLTSIKKKDVKSLNELHRKHISIRKFISYCQRYLNLRGLGKRTVLYHELVMGLLEISRTYRFLCKIQSKQKNDYSKEVLTVFEDTVRLQEEFYKLFFKHSIEDTQLIIATRMIIINKINDLSEEVNSPNLILLHRLPNILNTLYSLLNVTTAIHFEDTNS